MQRGEKRNRPLLSVIVPVYNTEKFLEKCLYSICNQSYKNIEIICVDDASPDGSAAIISRFAEKDERIRRIRHEENQGLLRARLTGISAAKGKYIAFVDSDDYISCDWFRPLVDRAENDGADMAVGNTVMTDEAGKRTYYNYFRSLTVNRAPLEGEEVLKTFLSQHGGCFLWHTVWNKIYRGELLKNAAPFLEEAPVPLVMGEDIAFSSVVWSRAGKVSFCDNDCYFYLRHGAASTSNTLPPDRIRKNVKDIADVFRFIGQYFERIGRAQEAEKDLEAFREKYFRIWSGNLRAAGMQSDKEAVSLLLQGFSKGALGEVRANEFWFYEASTEWDEKFEELRYKLRAKDVEVVSFDIFDTLICRPFWEPGDLLFFVGQHLKDIFRDAETFRAVRLEAEDKCRAAARAVYGGEDVTLSEIYGYMKEAFGFTEGEVCRMQEEEEKAELRFCYPREAGQTLFSLARAEGKRIFLISDMYLGEDTVRTLLSRCGYDGYEELFLSSSKRKLKGSGKLYRAALRKAGCLPSKVLHIGDNWSADIVAAERTGMRALFLPKATETYTNNISNIYTGDAFAKIYLGCHRDADSRGLIGQMSLRCLFACAANAFFDNPFRSFNSASQYNADPYFVGVTALGMHLFGLACWIRDIAERCGYDKIFFLARDGALAFRAYELLFGEDGRAAYFYANRRTLLPYAVRAPRDLYGIERYTDLEKTTPADILELFQSVCSPLTVEKLAQYRRRGVDPSEPFRTKERFFRFASAMAELSFDEKKAEKARSEASAAFRRIFAGNCACFDAGYSGRLQKIICELAGRRVDALYIHTNGYESERVAAEGGFGIRSFYGYTPNITSVLREYIISDPSPAAEGYRVRDGILEVLFGSGREENTEAEDYAVREMQRGALDFCAFLKQRLGGLLGGLYFRPQEISLPFENFLLDAAPFDRGMFSAANVEDRVYGGYGSMSFREIWEWHLAGLPQQASAPPARQAAPPERQYPFLQNRSKLAKALFYWSFDRGAFREKMYARRAVRKERRKNG